MTLKDFFELLESDCDYIVSIRTADGEPIGCCSYETYILPESTLNATIKSVHVYFEAKEIYIELA